MVDTFYGWLGVDGGIFWVSEGVWNFFMGEGVIWVVGAGAYYGQVEVAGGIFWVCGGG